MALMKTVILKKTISVASREGVSSFSAKTVAAESGCSEGLIFHYYNTKKELVDTCYRYIIDEFIKSVDFKKSDLPSLLGQYSHFMRKNREMALFSLEYIHQYDGQIGLDLITDAVRKCYGDMGEGFCNFITKSTAMFGCLVGSGEIKLCQDFGEKFTEIIRNMVDVMISETTFD